MFSSSNWGFLFEAETPHGKNKVTDEEEEEDKKEEGTFAVGVFVPNTRPGCL